MNKASPQENKVTIEMLIDYLQGKLSKEIEQQIEGRMNEDPLLMESIVELDLYLKNGGDPAKIIRQRNFIRKEIHHKKTSQSRWLPIAAAIVLLMIGAFAIFQFVNGGEEKLFAEYFQPYPDVVTTRAENMNEFSDAMNSYTREDYQTAESRFISLIEGMNDTDLAKFYLAQSQLAQGKIDPAIENLKSIADNNNNRLHTHAKWYLALAYIQKGEYKPANDLLEQIISEENSYNRNKAIELRSKIRE